MDTVSPIVSIFFDLLSISLSIAGICVSIHCWKHNYKDLMKQNKFIQELNAINFDEEYTFSKLMDIITRADSQDIDISKYFNVKKNKNKHSVTKNDIMSALYNLYHTAKDNNK